MNPFKLLFSLAMKMKPDGTVDVRKIRIGKMPVLILRPENPKSVDSTKSISSNARKNPDEGVCAEEKRSPALLWIHGGGHMMGMKEMVFIGRPVDLVKKFGVTVISPDYRLAWLHPYPAALKDCWRTLLFMHKYADQLHIDRNAIMVGGESAGGGLAAALCMLARDKNTVKIAWQFPLYPMLSNFDTETSRDNHGRVWNTRRNHIGWRVYLRGNAKKNVSPYASPSRQTDYSGLPPAYTFVGDGEPFCMETLTYISNLQKAGVEAAVDVYHSDLHAFDMMLPDEEPGREAIRRFEEAFAHALERIAERSENAE